MEEACSTKNQSRSGWTVIARCAGAPWRGAKRAIRTGGSASTIFRQPLMRSSRWNGERWNGRCGCVVPTAHCWRASTLGGGSSSRFRGGVGSPAQSPSRLCGGWGLPSTGWSPTTGTASKRAARSQYSDTLPVTDASRPPAPAGPERSLSGAAPRRYPRRALPAGSAAGT